MESITIFNYTLVLVHYMAAVHPALIDREADVAYEIPLLALLF